MAVELHPSRCIDHGVDILVTNLELQMSPDPIILINVFGCKTGIRILREKTLNLMVLFTYIIYKDYLPQLFKWCY